MTFLTTFQRYLHNYIYQQYLYDYNFDSVTLHWVIITPWWRHQMETFSTLLAIWTGNHRSPVNSPHKGQWRGALMFSLICVWINGWVNNREAGNLRRYRAHYDVIVMTAVPVTTMLLTPWILDKIHAIWKKRLCHHVITSPQSQWVKSELKKSWSCPRMI